MSPRTIIPKDELAKLDRLTVIEDGSIFDGDAKLQIEKELPELCRKARQAARGCRIEQDIGTMIEDCIVARNCLDNDRPDLAEIVLCDAVAAKGIRAASMIPFPDAPGQNKLAIHRYAIQTSLAPTVEMLTTVGVMPFLEDELDRICERVSWNTSFALAVAFLGLESPAFAQSALEARLRGLEEEMKQLRALFVESDEAAASEKRGAVK